MYLREIPFLITLQGSRCSKVASVYLWITFSTRVSGFLALAKLLPPSCERGSDKNYTLPNNHTLLSKRRLTLRCRDEPGIDFLQINHSDHQDILQTTFMPTFSNLAYIKVECVKNQPISLVFNSFWWNIIHKCVGWTNSQGISADTAPMQKRITQVTTKQLLKGFL